MSLSQSETEKLVRGASDGETAVLHARTTSTVTVESPPITPRNLTFVTPANPFPNARPFHTPDESPATPGTHLDSYPFPVAGHTVSTSVSTSVSASYTDLTPGASSHVGPISRPASGYNIPSRPGSRSALPRPSSARSREAFASPRTRPLTLYSTIQPSVAKIEHERPKSTMLTDTSVLEKPWLTTRDPYERIAYIITYAMIFLGIAGGAVRCYFGWTSVPLLTGNLCLVLEEDFNSAEGVFGANGTFFQEVDMSGFGNGEFEMTTDSSNNSYVQNGFLYITPTLTSDSIGENAIINGTVYNITGCTYNITQGLAYTSSSASAPISVDQPFNLAAYTAACSAISNATTGQIINPVQSARLTTRNSASIKYGRVDVRAKIPTGDWLWPAIWMLPVNNTYGPWPMSGEIDIMESRGNGPRYPDQGSNYVRGSLNWGPLTWLNAVSKTFGWWSLRRSSYDQGFHDYVLEWDEQFIRIYVDTRLDRTLQVNMGEPFFQRGNFPGVVQNGSEAIILENPWANGTIAAPFDQSFYLILDLAVGGTSGWFPDGAGGKPWLDESTTPMLDFWRQKDTWYATWPTDNDARSLVIDYVKMYQQC